MCIRDRRGEELTVRLELKLIADVGLVGFPNVGKSTLISVISAAKPKIANYHFTTLSPVLGVVKVGPEASFVAADIPGLIEGAADGVGLGHDFLRHVDRCRLLLHVVDVSGCEGRDPKDDFEKINTELERFSPELAQRPQIVLGNKCDIASSEQIEDFRSFVEEKGLLFLPVSAATRQGLDALPGLVYERLKELPPVAVYEPEYVKPVSYTHLDVYKRQVCGPAGYPAGFDPLLQPAVDHLNQNEHRYGYVHWTCLLYTSEST